MEANKKPLTKEDIGKMLAALPKVCESARQSTSLIFIGIAGLLHCCEKGGEEYFRTKFIAEEIQSHLRQFMTDLDEVLRNG